MTTPPNLPPEEKQQPRSMATEAPAFVRFFFDKSQPLPLRIAAWVVIIIIFTLPIFTAKKEPRGNSRAASDVSRSPANNRALPVEEGVDEMQKKPRSQNTEPSDSHDRPPEESSESKRLEAAEPPEQVLPKTTSISAQASGPFEALDGLSPAPIFLTEVGNKDIWAGTAREAAEIKAQDIANRRIKLNPQSYESIFNGDLPFITAGTRGNKDDLWIGTQSGQLMHYTQYDWKIVFEAKRPISDSIRALAFQGANLYIGAKGLWKYNTETGKLSRLKAFGNTLVNELRVDTNQRLLMATENGVWEFEDEGWATLSDPSTPLPSVFSVYADGKSGVIVGSQDGLLRLSDAGIILEKKFTGTAVLSVTGDGRGHIFAGTQGAGFLFFDGTDWYELKEADGLPSNTVSKLLLDSQNMLWLGLPGKGIFRIALTDAIKLFRNHKIAPEADPSTTPRLYGSACKAALKELRKSPISRDISAQNLGNQIFVYFSGQQVCPAGIGSRNSAGLTAVYDHQEILVSNAGQSQTISIPSDRDKSSPPKSIFVDSSNRIWVGFVDGLAVYQGDRWELFPNEKAFDKNPALTFHEDKNHIIWIGSSPKYDPQTGNRAIPSLHLFNNQEWAHLSSKNSVPGWMVNSLRGLKDGAVALGTNEGVSIARNDKFEIPAEKQPEFRRAVIHVSEDAEGRLWLSHLYFSNGLTIANGNQFQTFGEAEGLLSDRVAATAHDASNNVWVLSSNGQVGVYPQGFFEKPHPEFSPNSAAAGGSAQTESER